MKLDNLSREILQTAIKDQDLLSRRDFLDQIAHYFKEEEKFLFTGYVPNNHSRLVLMITNQQILLYSENQRKINAKIENNSLVKIKVVKSVFSKVYKLKSENQIINIYFRDQKSIGKLDQVLKDSFLDLVQERNSFSDKFWIIGIKIFILCIFLASLLSFVEKTFNINISSTRSQDLNNSEVLNPQYTNSLDFHDLENNFTVEKWDQYLGLYVSNKECFEENGKTHLTIWLKEEYSYFSNFLHTSIDILKAVRLNKRVTGDVMIVSRQMQVDQYGKEFLKNVLMVTFPIDEIRKVDFAGYDKLPSKDLIFANASSFVVNSEEIRQEIYQRCINKNLSYSLRIMCN
jgi:hypothetical protein